MLFSDICIEIMEAGKDTGHEQAGINSGEFYLPESNHTQNIKI